MTQQEVETLNGFCTLTSCEASTLDVSGASTAFGTVKVRAKTWPTQRPPADAEVLISTPVGGVTRGTVVLLTGGQGTDFWFAGANGIPVVARLVAAGYRVVQIRWPNGWFPVPWAGPVRAHSAACATLIEFARSQWFEGARFVVCGNSGGAAQAAYGLTTWNLHRICDTVVLCSGPPMVDMLAAGSTPPDPAFVAFVESVWPNEMDVDPEYVPAPGTIAAQMLKPGGADPQESILHTQPPPLLSYQRRDAQQAHDVPVVFLFGSEDAGIGQALKFHAAVQTAKVMVIVPGGQHWLAGTLEGLEAIVAAIGV